MCEPEVKAITEFVKDYSYILYKWSAVIMSGLIIFLDHTIRGIGEYAPGIGVVCVIIATYYRATADRSAAATSREARERSEREELAKLKIEPTD